jgi:hypothetical protein
MLVPTGVGWADKNRNGPMDCTVSGTRVAQTDQFPIEAKTMRVFRDSQTGDIGPPPHGVAPPPLTAAEQQMMTRSDVGLQPRTLPSGGVAVNLQGRYRNMAVATLSTNNKRSVKCVDTPAQAVSILHSAKHNIVGEEKR